jgi:hypothetical protein
LMAALDATSISVTLPVSHTTQLGCGLI